MATAVDTLLSAAEAAAAAAEALADAARGVAAEAAVTADAAAPAAEALGHASGVDPFVFRLAIFVLAIFIGYYVVWSVTPALHTPLMSVTNAISSVIVVGALVAVGADAADGATQATKVFGFIALVLASVNIFGGFLVTERMLGMYKPKEKK
jgi:NAD(P) transhydrogenase subunit alpha